jgi:arylsulfatase A-like enzyme
MSAPPPNILWIITTQWRAQATGYAGDPNARTPHLNALAAESVAYTQAVTPHPFGPFARAALLTGVPSPGNGIRDYYDPLPTDARTIAHRLGERGYATAFFGKWHLYRRDPAAPLVGEAQAKMVVPPEWRGGFECWEGFEGGFLLNDPWLHGTRLPEPVQFSGYQSDVICERAAAWIGGNGNRKPDAGKEGARSPHARRSSVSGFRDSTRPWFCFVSLEPPHPPYDAPAADAARPNPRELVLAPNVPRGSEVEAKARRELAGYYAHLEATDRAIGRMLAPLRTENTIVVVTSVHGDMHGAHGLFRKGWPYEESIRVPLLVWGIRPAGPGLGVQSPAPVSLLDLPRWAERWAQHGISVPVTEAETQRISMPSVVRLPQQCDRVWRGVRTPARKLVLNEDGAPWLFFDLERDPGEEHNLADEVGRAAELAACRRWL